MVGGKQRLSLLDVALTPRREQGVDSVLHRCLKENAEHSIRRHQTHRRADSHRVSYYMRNLNLEAYAASLARRWMVKSSDELFFSGKDTTDAVLMTDPVKPLTAMRLEHSNDI